MNAVLDDRGWRGVADEPARTLFDAAAEVDMLAPETIEARFVAFHQAHPDVYAKLVEFSLELLCAGWEHFGIAVVWERLRYETMLGAQPGEDGEPFKLNNSLRSRYARLIADQVPELADVFELRALRSASHPPERVVLADDRPDRRLCGSCRQGACRSCLDRGCDHDCDVRVALS